MSNTLTIQRSTKGIRDMLFDEIDSLRNGRTEYRRAVTLTRMCDTIIETAEFELQYAKFLTSAGKGDSQTPEIRLGSDV